MCIRDRNSHAVNLTEENFKNSRFSSRLEAKLIDVLDLNQKYNHIIINPPYFQEDTKSNNTVQRQSRHLGKMNYSKLINKLIELLTNEGSLEIIHPYRYLNTISDIVSLQKGSIERIIKIRHNNHSPVRNCISRIVLQDNNIKSERYFQIKNDSGEHSEEYINLLKPFLNHIA